MLEFAVGFAVVFLGLVALTMGILAVMVVFKVLIAILFG